MDVSYSREHPCSRCGSQIILRTETTITRTLAEWYDIGGLRHHCSTAYEPKLTLRGHCTRCGASVEQRRIDGVLLEENGSLHQCGGADATPAEPSKPRLVGRTIPTL